MKPEELERIRRENQLDQRQLAATLCATQGAVSKWLGGDNRIPAYVERCAGDRILFRRMMKLAGVKPSR